MSPTSAAMAGFAIQPLPEVATTTLEQSVPSPDGQSLPSWLSATAWVELAKSTPVSWVGAVLLGAPVAASVQVPMTFSPPDADDPFGDPAGAQCEVVFGLEMPAWAVAGAGAVEGSASGWRVNGVPQPARVRATPAPAPK